MKGLIIKDLKLILQNKFIIILMVLFSILGLIFDMDSDFMVAYFTICCTGLAISTCGYDEKNNTVSYLMTMPVSRREYVVEKYFFTSVCGFIGYFISVLIICINSFVFKKSPFEFTSLSFGIFLFLLPSLMIPLNIKFGTTKGRVVSLAVAGIISFIIAALVPPLIMMTKIENVEIVDDVTIAITQVKIGPESILISAGIVVILLAIYFISMLLSMRIIKHKSF